VDLAHQHDRPVLIRTVFGSIEGSLSSSRMLRLLDDLNVVAKRFLTVNDPVFLSGPWSRGDGPITINRDAIVFVRELQGCPPPPGNLRVASRFTRSAVELLLTDYAIQGFVHVTPDGHPMSRLNQGDHVFVALTSVTVVGPGEQFATPFLAVNRSHVLAARSIEQLEPLALVEPDCSELAAPLDDPAGI
jgi:hypothetical protein